MLGVSFQLQGTKSTLNVSKDAYFLKQGIKTGEGLCTSITSSSSNAENWPDA